MATLVLSAAGAAIGAGFGGSVLGLSGMVIGRAVGAVAGRMIDQRLMSRGSAGSVSAPNLPGRSFEVPPLDRLRLTGVGEGAALPRLWGRARIGGHVIWAGPMKMTPVTTRERVPVTVTSSTTSGGGGKGRPSAPRRVTTTSTTSTTVTRTETFTTISVALALCEGPVLGIGRIWADGTEISPEDLNLRLYPGDADQLPDPLIVAHEGASPAYRGTAYVVIEDLDVTGYGGRIPMLNFEVFRAAQTGLTLQDAIRGVAWLPGSGEYALATKPVWLDKGLGETQAANIGTPQGRPDMEIALDHLQTQLPRAGSSLLVASWFGDDLRCGQCTLRPKVERAAPEGKGQTWRVAGLTRAQAQVVPQVEGAPVYGGTPSDKSVLQAIAAMQAAGQKVVFYPFILMDQLSDNQLSDPWTGAGSQPVLPWRGRITLSVAPGRDGTPDRSAAAAAQVAQFMGNAQPGDFAITPGQVTYSGPNEWRYRRFILHYAALCAAAGGVDAFCIGSEMRSLTQIRGAGDSFPAVAALIQLAADVRAILPDAKITYAADWSEYFGYQDETGNRYFHLDPLWADENIDVIGIDNYMPLSDWREGEDHLDADAGSVHSLPYLRENIASGEGFTWYYSHEQARAAQLRTPIEDPLEPWIWRYKDLRGWWENPHHDRVDGVRAEAASPWVPRSKPFWFTELGCPAVDKGTNQPNVFFDAKSSESALPYFSNGLRDDLMQMQYLRAQAAYWTDPANNPMSDLYEGPMVDWDRAHVWAWDARPWPWFPARADLWSDAANWARGHWITGRVLNQPLDAVVADICAQAGIAHVDVSDLRGIVRGYTVASTDSPRRMLQGLMLAYGFDAVERGGVLRFVMRGGRVAGRVGPEHLVAQAGGDLALTRDAEPPGRVRLGHVAADGDYDVVAAEAVFPDTETLEAAGQDLSLVLTRPEATRIARRLLAETRVAQDRVSLALPPSSRLGAGDVLALDRPEGVRLYRIDRAEIAGAREISATRIEPGLYRSAPEAEEVAQALRIAPPPAPVLGVFLDLPLFSPGQDPVAPHLAVTATPWPGLVALHSAPLSGEGWALNRFYGAQAAIGVTEMPLGAARPGLWDRGAGVIVRMRPGVVLSNATEAEVMDGANALAIGPGTPDGEWEIVQYRDAVLLAPDLWHLRHLLRGQAGTDAAMPPVWPVGATVVRLDAAVDQFALSLSQRGLARRYRIGPASRPLDDPSHEEITASFAGRGLRPLRPAHLRAQWQTGPGSTLAVTWIRRGRINADSWEGFDIPLGEESQLYLLRVTSGNVLRREVLLATPQFTYFAAMQAEDEITGPFQIAVAQVSTEFGPGPFAMVEIND